MNAINKVIKDHESASRPVDGNRFTIEVSIKGSDEDLKKIDHVIYWLPSSFPNRIAVSADSANRFSKKMEVWGEFLIDITVFMKDNTEKKAELWIDLGLPGSEEEKKQHDGTFK